MKTFKVYVNGLKIPYVEIAGSLKASKNFIRNNLKSTHMGAWRKLQDGYAYDTTIGRYYEFRNVENKLNYKIGAT